MKAALTDIEIRECLGKVEEYTPVPGVYNLSSDISRQELVDRLYHFRVNLGLAIRETSKLIQKLEDELNSNSKK
jgi:hypothetical protein